MNNSDLNLNQAIHAASLFSPIKIYYNKECIWDDTLALGEGWIPLKEALKNFRAAHKDYSQIVVTNVKIDIVEWHHSIIHLKGKRKEKNK
jgi:hypothetical protein